MKTNAHHQHYRSTLQAVFSIIVPGTTSLTAAQQASFSAGITSFLQGPSFNSSVTISGVTAFNGTSAIVNGFVTTLWSATPTVTQLSFASSLRDSMIATLTTNTSTLTGFPSSTANCACNGISVVTAVSTDTLVYSTNVTTPGPMQCGARLSFSPAALVTNQVGIDDGTVAAANRGKYCSTPAVSGGVVGVPGTSSCIQYGVIASNSGSSQATATVSGAQLLAGRVTALTTVTTGAGYTSAPTVTISAPTQIPAQVTVTVTSAGAATAAVTPTDNGPYVGTTLTASALGNGPCVSALCSGTDILTINLGSTTVTGRRCTSSDFNTLSLITVSTTTGAASLSGAGTLTNWVCTPSQVPLVTLNTNTLQAGNTATAIATISSGGVSTITVINQGSGYVVGTVNLPTVTIAAPSSNNIGKLCSLNPITLDSTIAVNSAISTGVTTSGQCQPIGLDTIASVPCSIPAAPGGTYSPINAGTCNVISSFIAQPAASTTYKCGVVAQSFTTSVVSPVKPPAPAPAPLPTTPTPGPAPTTPPTTATYRGRFQIGSVACKGKFLAASAGCGDRLVYLRTVSQSKGSRTFWAIDGTAGVATGVASVVRVGKCNGNTNLASAQSTPTPVIGGGSWRVKLTPVDAAKPLVVTIEATDKTYKAKFLQVGDQCDDQKGFSWAAKSSSTGQQWELLAVSSN